MTTNSSHSILKYKPFRKINVDATTFNFSDKNFTIITSVGAISDLDQSDVPTTYKCNDVIDPNDFYYKNLDMNEWDLDNTNMIYPIFSFGEQIKYDQTSLDTGNFYNCHCAFIYKGQIHWIINDGTSNPAIMHLKIDLPSHLERQKTWNHLIFTRNDNMFLIHLYVDRWSVLGTFRFEDAETIIPVLFPPSEDIVYFDPELYECDYNTDATAWYHAPINKITESILQNSCTNLSGWVYKQFNSEPITVSGYYKFRLRNFTTGYMYYYGFKNMTDRSTWESVLFGEYNAAPGSYQTTGSFYLNAGDTVGFRVRAYQTSAFTGNYQMYVGEEDDNIFSLFGEYGEPIEFSYDNVQNWGENGDLIYKTAYKLLDYNLNLNDIHGSNDLKLGYIERYPLTPSDGTILYKNSMNGIMTEFMIYEDQAYQRKYNNFLHNYSNEYTNKDSIDINYDSKTKKIINANNLSLKIADYLDTQHEAPQNNDGVISNNIISLLDIRVATKSDNEIDAESDETRSEEMAMPEFDNIPTDSTSWIVHFDKNDIAYDKNICFGIFTFELEEIINDTTSKVSIEKYLISKVDYSLTSYDKSKSYENYIVDNSTYDYVTVHDINSNKSNILAAINNKISAFNKNVIKFYVKLFRDERYIIYYSTKTSASSANSGDVTLIKYQYWLHDSDNDRDIIDQRTRYYYKTDPKIENGLIYLALGPTIEDDATAFIYDEKYLIAKNDLLIGNNVGDHEGVAIYGYFLIPKFKMPKDIAFNNSDYLNHTFSGSVTYETLSDQILFDKLELQDTTGNVYASIDGTEVRDNIYNDNHQFKLYELAKASYPDSTIFYDFNKLLYIVGTISNKEFILSEFNILKKYSTYVNVDTTVSKVDDNTYKIEYDNSNLGKYKNAFIEFSNNKSISYEYGLYKEIFNNLYRNNLSTLTSTYLYPHNTWSPFTSLNDYFKAYLNDINSKLIVNQRKLYTTGATIDFYFNTFYEYHYYVANSASYSTRVRLENYLITIDPTLLEIDKIMSIVEIDNFENYYIISN